MAKGTIGLQVVTDNTDSTGQRTISVRTSNRTNVLPVACCAWRTHPLILRVKRGGRGFKALIVTKPITTPERNEMLEELAQAI